MIAASGKEAGWPWVVSLIPCKASGDTLWLCCLSRPNDLVIMADDGRGKQLSVRPLECQAVGTPVHICTAEHTFSPF